MELVTLGNISCQFFGERRRIRSAIVGLMPDLWEGIVRLKPDLLWRIVRLKPDLLWRIVRLKPDLLWRIVRLKTDLREGVSLSPSSRSWRSRHVLVTLGADLVTPSTRHRHALNLCDDKRFERKTGEKRPKIWKCLDTRKSLQRKRMMGIGRFLGGFVLFSTPLCSSRRGRWRQEVGDEITRKARS